MRPESERKPWRTTVGIISAGILFASLIWGTIAVGEEDTAAQRLDVGAPVTEDSLRDSRGQGQNTPVTSPPGDIDILSVILWDEAHRPPPPAGGTPATGLSSTVNGVVY